MTEKVGFRPGVKSGCLGKLWITRVLNRRQSDSHRERKCAENYNKWILNLFFKTTISILIISNHNSFGVLLDKIASVYFIWKKNIYIYIYISIGNSQPRELALCQLYRHTFGPYRNNRWVRIRDWCEVDVEKLGVDQEIWRSTLQTGVLHTCRTLMQCWIRLHVSITIKLCATAL